MRARTHIATGMLFSLPALAGLLTFVVIPFLLAMGLSFTNMRLGSPLPTAYVGIEQFARLFADPVFLRALFNNLLFTVLVVPVQTLLALGIALLLHQPLKGRAVFRTLFFMPVVFPLSLVSVVWILIYAPGADGMLNSVLHTLSLGHWQARDFLHDSWLALPAILLTSVWQGVGFQMVILLAGLQGISNDLYEAARIDGAGRWQRFWHVTLPQLRNPLIFVMLVTTILAFRLFEQVQIMTHGGPQHATTTLMYEAVQAAFTRQQVGKGAAISVIFFMLVLGVTLVQRRVAQQERV